tara:strand:+ start:1395 stop:2474 length:1080 start_codon:yes stop_codon:yes gene_type:complete
MILKSICINTIFLLFTFVLAAQITTEYYDSAKNLSGEELKNELNQIIDNHTEYYYTGSEIDVWDILKHTDRDPNNSDNVILIYSGISVNGAQEYNNANGWTREHIWAKSRGDFGTATGVGTDVHALRPLDNTTNSIRNNRNFNNCSTCIDVLDKWGNTTGSKKDANDWTFEPRDEVKGDVARMMFYMAVRYEGLDNYPDLELVESILSKENKEPLHGVLSTLLEWHINDPVDAWEENRNNIIYSSYQHNRNPFIDYPILAEHIWGSKINTSWTGEQSLNDTTYNKTPLRIYPNPTSDFLNIKGLNTSAKVCIYDINGRKLFVTKIDANQNSIDVSMLSGIYLLDIITLEKKITKIVIIK